MNNSPQNLCYIALVLIFTAVKLQVSASGNLQNGEVFDFIVVGAGTAGCAIAARLAESGKHSVLLISEGGFPHPDFEVPALSSNLTLMSNPNYVKLYSSVPQINAARADNGNITLFIGKLLGGGSGINEMFTNRGNQRDYDNWATLTGDESWNYSNLLKYFRNYENYAGINPTGQRGFKGPITISHPSYRAGFAEWFQGGVELGYPIRDPNGPQTESFAWVDLSQKHGRRISSFKGYIEPMLQSKSGFTHSTKPNLVILTHTTANRILFDGNRATGVNFTTNSTGQSVTGYARARKEIIVSAGAMEGPKSILEKANIPSVKYLPVGRNLQEHIFVPIPIIFGNKSAALDPERDLTPDTWRLFQETGQGPYSSYLGASGQAFIASSALSPIEKSLGWPDLHLFYTNANSVNYASPSVPTPNDLKQGEIAVLWNAILTRPKSRGSVSLDMRDIDNPPVIDYKFLTHPYDMRALIAGSKLLVKLCEETSGFQRIGCRISTIPFHVCSHLKFLSDPYWECYVTQTTSTGLHASGTNKMGRGPEDSEAVVDTKLRVIGIDKLRVCDASIMPFVTNANTQAAVYVIAEKAADMILQKWEKSDGK